MYRAVTAMALRGGYDPNDAVACSRIAAEMSFHYVGGTVCMAGLSSRGSTPESVAEVIYGPQVTAAVSAVSAHVGVREVLVAEQQRLAREAVVDYVLEGRDIGTVVAPEARLKLFLTATIEVRTERARLSGRATIAAQIAERDRLDSTRAVSPLCPAADAIILDTTNLVQREVLVMAEALLRFRGFKARLTA